MPLYADCDFGSPSIRAIDPARRLRGDAGEGSGGGVACRGSSQIGASLEYSASQAGVGLLPEEGRRRPSRVGCARMSTQWLRAPCQAYRVPKPVRKREDILLS